MQSLTERGILAKLLAKVRRRLFRHAAAAAWVRASLFALPAAALLIAANERWGEPLLSRAIAAAVLGGTLVFAAVRGWRGLGARVHAALRLDDRAQLKDRVSSAWEFLELPELNEAQQVQVRDAIRRAEALDCRGVLRFEWPRFAAGLPVAALLLVASFFVPPLTQNPKAIAAKDPVKEAQLQQLDELKQELQAKQDLPPELQEVLKKLDDIRKQFEKGELGEREVMLQLGRLDENLRSKVAELGVENLENEMQAIIPHLAASAATRQVAQALKEQKLDKAAQELKDLADKVAQEKLSKEEQKKLAAQLGTAAAKLGKKKTEDSFSGDLAEASECLEKSDCEGFKGACQSMGQKLGLLSKCKGLKSACNKIGLCKAGLGQCNNKELGFTPGPKTQGKQKGGLKAGTAASGDPYGDPNRLADSFKKLLQVSGQAGQGPVETETEITEGQMSQSQLSAREIHANFAAAAEEVIEKEDIPLSHRFHVKRYFQAIRPQE
jgi:hypothetical protein